MSHASRRWPLLSLALLVLLLPQVQAAAPLSQEAARSPEEIRRLHDAPPTRAPVLDTPPAQQPAAALAPEAPPAYSRIAFESARNEHDWDIYLIYPDGSGESLLTPNTANDVTPSLQRGIYRAAFASGRDGNYEVYTALADGTSVFRLTYDGAEDSFPAWSPDSMRVALQSKRAGNFDIWLVNADGTGVVQLTTDSAYDGHPSWSPDGSQIAFVSLRSGRYELWVMNADGSNQHQVTAGATAFNPAWSPDGSRIAYSNDGDGDGWLEVWVINPDGSGAARLLDDLYQMDSWAPSWAPDGQWLSFNRTYWTYAYGNWYWTYSYLNVYEFGSGNVYTLTGDDTAWRSSWATTDIAPPGPCAVSLAAQQRWSSFLLSWGAEDGGSGVALYDVQVRAGAAAPWVDLYVQTPQSGGLYPGQDGDIREFRCRARDAAGNLRSWSDAPVVGTAVDSLRPASTVLPLPALLQGPSVPVAWHGQDASGVASYDVFVRQGTAGDWTLWLDDTTATAANYSGAPGHTYYFRSQATDAYGHTEPWRPDAQAHVTLYAHTLELYAADNRGLAGLQPTWTLDPAPLDSTADPGAGRYRFALNSGGACTATVAAAGFSAVPTTTLSVPADSGYAFSLPPADDTVANGGWETGTLDGWSAGAAGAEVSGTLRHTGRYALRLERELTATAAVSQVLWVSPTLRQPTLGLWYNLPADLVSGTLAVELAVPTATTVFSASAATAGWAYAWVDVTGYASRTVTLTVALRAAAGSAWVDEVALGSWWTPQVQAVTPAAWWGYDAATLTISGSNFYSTPQVLVGDIAATAVTWVSPTLLYAALPAGMPAGTADVVVINPDGPAGTLAGGVTVRWQEVFLPLVVRGQSEGLPVAEQEADWLTLGYDAAHSGVNQGDAGASRYALAWSADVSAGYSSGERPLEQVAVGDGLLAVSVDAYFGTAGLTVLDADTGQEVWRRTFVDKYSINPPSIAYGAVYFQQGRHSNDSYLFCLDLYSGQQRWQSPFGAQWETYLAPLVVGDGVYVNGGISGGMYGYNAGSGAQLWYAGLQQYSKWTPAYSDGMLYTWVERTFRAHNPATGVALWWHDLPSGGWAYEMDTTPVIAGRLALVVSGEALMAVDLDSHVVKWSAPGNFIHTIPAVADDTIYALNAGAVDAYRLADGQLLWSYPADGALVNAPLVAGGYLYVASDAHTYVLDRATHAVVWEAEHGGWLTVADGYLYVAQADKMLYAYRAQEP